MEIVIRLSQKAYGICIVAMGTQQLAYGDFDPNFLPGAFSSNAVYQLLAYPWGIAFTLSGIALLINKKAFEVALISGGVFLACSILAQVPYVIFVEPNRSNILTWSAALSALAFAGSSFQMAASLRNDTSIRKSNIIIHWLEKLIPLAGIFFSMMLIIYGVDHFLFIEMVSTLVPSWIPNHYFWTYFAGVALIGAGVAIIFKIKVRIIASLLGTMIFLWFILLHIPRAMADPFVQRGRELTRVFVTLGFSGVAFLFAFVKSKI